jgi:Flp pilus assembly protein TadB
MLRMKNRNNIHFILEVFWLIAGILTAIMALLTSLKRGINEGYMFFIMALLCFVLYFIRRSMRLKEPTGGNN